MTGYKETEGIQREATIRMTAGFQQKKSETTANLFLENKLSEFFGPLKKWIIFSNTWDLPKKSIK